MDIITPEQVAAFFSNKEARVDDEVARIQTMLTERAPFTRHPSHTNHAGFAIPLPENYDLTFVETVAGRFRAAGWEAKIEHIYAFNGNYQALCLRHKCLAEVAMNSIGIPVR